MGVQGELFYLTCDGGGDSVPKKIKNCKKVSKLINLIPFGVFGFEWVSVDKTTVFANVQLFKNKHARVR